MKKFRDVKPKLDRTGMLNDDAQAKENPKASNFPRSKTHDKNNRELEAKPKLTKAELLRYQNDLEDDRKRPPVPMKNKATLQAAGKDMVNRPKQQNFKVGANNPPPLEQPNVVYYTPESKEDIFSLVPQVDPVQAHREKYIPRNIPNPRGKKPSRPIEEEEVKVPKKEGIPMDKGYIAPKKDKNFIKANYNEAADESQMKLKARGAQPKAEEAAAKTKNYGKVPKYLQKYNSERDREVKRKQQLEEDKDVSANRDL